MQRITSATKELETGVKSVGTQSDGIELREELNSKKDAIVADIQTMKNILQRTKERWVPRGLREAHNTKLLGGPPVALQ